MARALREAWVLGIITKKLNDALERRDRDRDPQSLKADEIVDTIGPSGELRLPGGTGKLLQVIEVRFPNILHSPANNSGISYDDYQTYMTFVQPHRSKIIGEKPDI